LGLYKHSDRERSEIVMGSLVELKDFDLILR